MQSITEAFQLLIAALAAYRWRPFSNLTVEDIDNLLS